MSTLRKLADVVTDVKIVSGVVVTIVGVAVWVAIEWTSLTHRVNGIEETQSQEFNIKEGILNQLNDLKTQQAVISTQVTGIDAKATETNSLVRELLKLLRQ